ncbi:MAG TPA: 16S rRNA (cytidine(1402)-2'-O)-methyltransferase [Candidatus Paceibacterota bacterium]|nr:16S rRNA (cytidine(1402)-2'-O)-methyltransferase [Candidatus Paceibacterota bacterium]
MGNLYIVATPIGNLEDITLRALRILKEVDLVLCEDTRETRKLLSHYEIKTPTESYHAQSSLSKIDRVISLLKEGKNLALVSDAGTPSISDPGSLLIKRIHEELPEVKVLAIPGASALTAAFSISGITGGEFVFLGFLPHKKGRETLFKEIAGSSRPYVFYESSHRILKALESIQKFAPKKKVFIARELTKMFEELLIGSASEILEVLKGNLKKQKGEFVVLVE